MIRNVCQSIQLNVASIKVLNTHYSSIQLVTRSSWEIDILLKELNFSKRLSTLCSIVSREWNSGSLSLKHFLMSIRALDIIRHSSPPKSSPLWAPISFRLCEEDTPRYLLLGLEPRPPSPESCWKEKLIGNYKTPSKFFWRFDLIIISIIIMIKIMVTILILMMIIIILENNNNKNNSNINDNFINNISNIRYN